MTGSHGDIGPELRQLAQFILDRLDPAVRAAADRASAPGEGPCQQVFCPVCAGVALINGQQHPLLDLLAEHSVGLLTILRAMLKTDDPAPPSPPAPDHPSGPKPQPAGEPAATCEPAATGEPAAAGEPEGAKANGRYQPITVILEGSSDD